MDTIRTFQALSLSTSLLLSGINIGASLLTIPLLYPLPPATSTSIFSGFYSRGAVTNVPLGIFSASCSALVAYLLPQQQSQRQLWIFAALATISQLPWTALVMSGTNNRLIAIAAAGRVEMGKVDKGEVDALLGSWAWMNGVRGLLALGGGLMGLWAVMGQ